MTSDAQPRKTLCGVVVNDLGEILPYTARSTVFGCKEFCREMWPETWDKMKALGCRVVLAEITVLQDPAVKSCSDCGECEFCNSDEDCKCRGVRVDEFVLQK